MSTNRLVEQVKNRVVRRLFEDAEQDRLFRKQAIDVYKGLVEYLKSGGNLKEYGRAVTIDQFTDLEQKAPNPLKIRFEQKDKASADAVYRNESDGPVIVMYVLGKDIYGSQEEARRAMRRGLENRAKIFMHEYIHYLDDRRTSLGIQDLASYEPGEDKRMSVYFSDPFEVNAYFQSGLAQLEHTLEVPGLLDTRMERDWNGNFRDFKDWFFDEHIPPRMQYNISEDQEKRLINRLYGFWERIEKQYNS
jgi:hypothetical protein